MMRPGKVILIFFLTFFGLYAAFMLVYFPTSEPSFCDNCHFIKPYVVSWEDKPHQSVKCLFCHEQRGVLGKIDSKSRGSNYVYLTVTKQVAPVITYAKIFEQNCVTCHLGGYSSYPNASKLDQEHMDYLKQDKSCLACHQDTAHAVNIGVK